ncbi:tRNA pseudouridine(38-40) synthase TruA [Methylomonas sp. AM2-LC]|uniref:tRNA pseudouridine(38-40) synthase TruA n=1 Tax=Methylomonas sp. AM2-LC TaxID=3153301 RepID=UPI003265022C
MTRIVLGVEYDGSAFSGWQWQTNKRTVQSELQTALSKIADQEISVICAGRTDAGVHALEQVVHFDTQADRDIKAWVLGVNSALSDDVRVTWAQPAVADFHARYSAIARFYRYVILNRAMKSALFKSQVTWCYQELDADKMHRAAQYLLGEHDFSSFRAQGCQSKSPWRMMHFIDVYRRDEQVIIDICANAFLHHMVRNITGVLMEIGMGRQPENWTQHLLHIKDRAQAGVTAPPHGLHLGAVYYPECYAIHKHPVFDKLPKDVRRFD